MSAGSHKSIVVASCETWGPVGAVPLWFCSVSSRPHFLTKPAEHVLIQVAVSNGKTFRKCLEKAPWRTQRVIKIFRTWLWLSGWRRKWQPTPVFLPGESQGWGSLEGCHLWGRTEVDTTEVTQQQQKQWLRGKESACRCRRRRRQGFIPWVRKTAWSNDACRCRRRRRQGFSPWVRKTSWSNDNSLQYSYLGNSMDRGA